MNLYIKELNPDKKICLKENNIIKPNQTDIYIYVLLKLIIIKNLMKLKNNTSFHHAKKYKQELRKSGITK